MRDFNVGLMCRAALTYMDTGQQWTQAEAVERIEGWGKDMTKPELVQIIGVLAAAYLKATEDSR